MSEDIYFPSSPQSATFCWTTLEIYVTSTFPLSSLTMGPLDKMKQSVTYYRFFFFSPLQPPPETLPENEVYFVAGNKSQCLTLIFVFQTGFSSWIKRVDHTHLKAENYLFCMKPIVFALVKGANKSYTNVREGGRTLKVTKVHKQ